MKTLKTFLAVALLAFAAVSCVSSGDPERKTTQTYSSCFNHVLNLGNQSDATFANPSYVMEFDFDTNLAKIEINNAKFAEMMPAINMTLEGLKWKYNSAGFRTIEATDVVPMVNGEAMEQYILTKFNVAILDRYVYGSYEPIVNISYVVDGAFRVVAVPRSIIYVGSTGVVDTAFGTNFTTTAPVYQVVIDQATMTAEINIDKAKFAEAMPPMDMKFKGIAVKVTESGYELAKDSLVPEIASTPYPAYTITNLTGAASWSTGMDLRFTCASKFAVTVKLGYVSEL